MHREQAHTAHNWIQVYCGCEQGPVWPAPCAIVVEGVREIKGARQGPGNPRLGPGVGVGVTFTNPTQKSGGMTPETVTPSAGQGEAAVGWKGSHVGEGMALAKGFVLLRVESLSFQVDLTYLGTARVQSFGVGGSRKSPFPTSHESQRQDMEESW